MGNPNQVIGRAKVKVDGQLFETGKGNTTLEPGGPMREPKEGDYDNSAFSETTKGSKLTFSVLTKNGFSATAFGAITDATVTVEFDNGKTFIIRHACSESAPPMKTDGLAECVMFGPAAEEIR
jgi:hypothetical protein